MKTLNQYLYESLDNNEEILLDEGFKDWVKRAAVGTALASSILSPTIARADTIMTPKDMPNAKPIAHKIVQDYADNNEDVDVFISHAYSARDMSFAKDRATSDLITVLSKLQKKSNISTANIIKNYKMFKSKDGKVTFAFILNGGTLGNSSSNIVTK